MNQTIEVSLPPLGEDKTYIQTKADCEVKVIIIEPVDSIDIGGGVKITGRDLVKETVKTFPYKQMLDEEENLKKQITAFQENIDKFQIRLDEITTQKEIIEPKAETALAEKVFNDLQ